MGFPVPAPAQPLDEPVEVVLGNINFSLDTDVLEDGSQVDFSFGYRYARSIDGEIRLRYVKESYNDDIYDLGDSLMANDELTFEVFLLPFRYHFFNTSIVSFNVAAGVYYDYNALNQHGYFNRSDLAPANPAFNTQRNDFSMHILGPLAEAGLRFQMQPVDVRLKAGIAPIFYLRRDQSVQINPLMGPEYFDHSQDTSGSPYVYGELSGIFFKLISLSLLYEYARIDYDVYGINLNNNGNEWTTPAVDLVSQSFKVEVAALLPLGRELYFQIGYGHSFDTITTNSETPVEENANYIIIGTKKISF
jgi:hypothetical protein